MLSTLNSDLDSIINWGKNNRVEFNASKTQCCLLSLKRTLVSQPLSINGACVDETGKLSILGMCINSTLSWNDHIFEVAKNAAKCLGFLNRCKKYFTPSLALIHKAYIRPKLEYNAHIWSGAPKTTLHLLDRIQKRAIKLIGDNNIAESLDSLEHRRTVSSLSVFYRYFNKRCSSELANCIPPLHEFTRNTRLARNAHQFTLKPTFGRTVKFRDSFFSPTTRIWNALPSLIFPTDYNPQIFKTNVHRYLLSLSPSVPSARAVS
jgi:hypothetical protein